MNILALDIGGSYIKYALFIDGKICHDNKTKSHGDKGPQAISKNVDKIVESIKKENRIDAVAISTAGVVDIYSGQIIHSGPNIPDYVGFNWKDYINKKFALDCQVENDVNCAGLGETIYGAAKGEKYVLCLAVGTGIGGSFINEGRVYHGNDFSAMEIGYLHMDGKVFEQIASTSAMVNNYIKRSGNKEANGKIIFELAKKGDKIAISSIENMVDILCKGIANIAFVINPSCLVLGGGIMEQVDYLQDIVMEKLKKYLTPIALRSLKVAFAQNGNLASCYGAYHHYIQMMGQ